MLKVLIICCLISLVHTIKPVVLWHGMGDSCCNPLSLGRLIKLIEQNFKDEIYVTSLQIGSDFLEDTENGFFMNANKQIEMACNIIANDTNLKNGYNAIGFSQGAQFLRAVAQRCSNPPMNNLISIGGQHQGIYGLPRCLYPQHTFCDYLRSLLNYAAYWSWVQNSFVQAEYWHDPLNEAEYRKSSAFIAEINNDRPVKNNTYRTNLMKLNNFVMVMFENDTMVEPRETEWFGFYQPNKKVEILTLQQSQLYQDDWLGLKEMDKNGKLKFLSVPGDHLRFSEDWFINEIVNKFLID